MIMANILFLDIDGVLKSTISVQALTIKLKLLFNLI